MGNPKYRNKFQQRNNTPNYEGSPRRTSNTNNQVPNNTPSNSLDRQVTKGKYAQMLAALKNKITPTGSTPEQQAQALENATSKAHKTPAQTEATPEYSTSLPNVERTGERSFTFNRTDTVQCSYNQTAPKVYNAATANIITPSSFTSSSPGLFTASNENGRVALTIDPNFEGQMIFTVNGQSESIILGSQSAELIEAIDPQEALLLTNWQESLQQLETVKNNLLVADRPTYAGNPTWRAYSGEIAQLEQEFVELLYSSDWQQDITAQQQIDQKLTEIGTLLVQYEGNRSKLKPAKETVQTRKEPEVLPFNGLQRLSERVFTLDNSKRAWVYAEGFNNNKSINIANVASLQGVFTATEYADGYRVTVDPLFDGVIQLQQWETDDQSNWEAFTVEPLPNRFTNVVSQYKDSLANNDMYKRFTAVGEQYIRLLQHPKTDPQLRRLIGAEYEQLLDNFSESLKEESTKKPEKKSFFAGLMPSNLESTGLYSMGKDVVLSTSFTPKMNRFEIRNKLLQLSNSQEFSSLNDEQMMALFELKRTLPKVSGEVLDDEASPTFNRRDIQAVAVAIQKDMFANNRDQIFTEAMQEMGLNPDVDRGTETSFGIRLVLGLPLNAAEQKLYNELQSAPSLLADADYQIYNGERQLASGRYQLAVGGNKLNKGYQMQRKLGWIPILGGIIRKKVSSGQAEYNAGAARLQAGESKLQDGKMQRAEGRNRFVNTLQRLEQAKDDVQQGVLEEAMLQLIVGMDAKHIGPMSGAPDLSSRNATMEDLLRIEAAGAVLGTIGRKDLDAIGSKSGASIKPYPPNGLTLDTIEWMIAAQGSVKPPMGRPESGAFWIETNSTTPTETTPIADDLYRLAQSANTPKPQVEPEQAVQPEKELVVEAEEVKESVKDIQSTESETEIVPGATLDDAILTKDTKNSDVIQTKEAFADIYPEGVEVLGNRMQLSGKAFSIFVNGKQFNYRSGKEFAENTDMFKVKREGSTYTFTLKPGVHGLQLFRNEVEKAWVPIPFSTSSRLAKR